MTLNGSPARIEVADNIQGSWPSRSRKLVVSKENEQLAVTLGEAKIMRKRPLEQDGVGGLHGLSTHPNCFKGGIWN